MTGPKRYSGVAAEKLSIPIFGGSLANQVQRTAVELVIQATALGYDLWALLPNTKSATDNSARAVLLGKRKGYRIYEVHRRTAARKGAADVV